jgi:hypothetical protein
VSSIEALNALGPTLQRAASMQAGRKMRRRTEQGFQASLVNALPYVLPREAFFFHIPNGGWRKHTEAGILVGQGVKAGMPDLMIIWQGRAFGLELKSDIGRVSSSQKIAHAHLRTAGMPIAVVRSFAETIDALCEMGIPLRIKQENANV